MNLGAKRDVVVLGPSAGIDCAVINLGDKSLIVKTDPITGALERIGWLAVNVNANDVSTFGVEPAFFLSCVLLPEKADRKTVEIISTQMDTAKKLLLSGDYNVNQISDKLGYQNAESFIRQFKRTVGCTPTGYKMKNGVVKKKR